MVNNTLPIQTGAKIPENGLYQIKLMKQDKPTTNAQSYVTTLPCPENAIKYSPTCKLWNDKKTST